LRLQLLRPWGFNMIALPPGFDFSLLTSDFYSAALPFVSVAVLFGVYRIITKILGGVRWQKKEIISNVLFLNISFYHFSLYFSL
jgi:hypothetical protein